jgi:hypothetical protein
MALESEPHARREATAPSIIREMHKIQRGKEMPPDAGIVLPQNAPMEPLFSEV